MPVVSENTISQLRQLANKYETTDFIIGDPSWFMHQVNGFENQETIAFLAAALSYGSRKQFLPKIEQMLLWSEQQPYIWVKKRLFSQQIHQNDNSCYYRLYNNNQMWLFLDSYRQLLETHGSIKQYIAGRQKVNHDALQAIGSLCSWFAPSGTNVIPKDTTSACKRLCMFLRWMVRDNSPVDLGIWADIIDKQTLIMPLDTHVLTEAQELGLIKNRNASMSAALLLTDTLRQVFPDDPTKGDFALFGYGVNKKS